MANVTITITPNPVHIGSSVTFTCSADADPPIVLWSIHKNGVSTKIYEGTSTSHTIDNISTSDAGEYKCKGQPGDGESTFETLQVSSKL